MKKKMTGYIDYTLLKLDALKEDIARICNEAMEKNALVYVLIHIMSMEKYERKLYV